MSETDFLEEVEEELSSDDLVRLAELVKSMNSKELALTELMKQVENAEKEIRILKRETIPDLLMSKGLRAIELEDGHKVSVQEKVAASFPRKDATKKAVVLQWLQANGGGALIDNEVRVTDPEQSILEYLRKEGIPYRKVIDVNHQRFLSFLRGKLGLKKGSLPEIESSDVPKEANLYIYKETKVTK